MTERYALIIGNSQYTDKTLQQLITPAQDVEALARVLENPAIGNFEIDVKLNVESDELRREIERFFAKGKSADSLLFYFSGHGVIEDYSGELYLAVKDTEKDILDATAISSGFIRRNVRKSYAESKVIILDCCYSGAVTNESLIKGPPEVTMAKQFRGKGVVFLSASTAWQYAFQETGVEKLSEDAQSLFTRFLVQGLETGGADLDNDGVITADELYEYVFERVRESTPNQTPEMSEFGRQGSIVIANNVKHNLDGVYRELQGAIVGGSTDIELLQSGETILNDQYIIEKYLGSGGQGQVYLARHPIFDQVAVKRLHPYIAAMEGGLERFKRELRITHQLRGEHVILIHNFDRDLVRDEWFSIMEYANGGNLKDKLATEAPLPILEAIQLTIALCQALASIHLRPYVHGDLKPSNVLFHTKPSRESILQLSDFGSAFQPIRAGVLPLPSGLKTARTQLYVSPELLDASDPEDMEALTTDVDQRADIYAIGVILYEMLTGRPPFWELSDESEDGIGFGERQHALLQKIKYQVPPEPKKQRSEILLSLNDLVMKALAKKPAERFANVGEMQARLEEILREEQSRLAELDHLRPLAAYALEGERWGQANDLIQKILDLAPDDPDALQKQKIARSQQRLVSLHNQIPRKMRDKLWQEAKDLVEEALEIAPGDAILMTWKEEVDDQLTIIGILEQAKEAEKSENWLEVCRLCRQALELDQSHPEASSLLRRAQTQSTIAKSRRRAKTLRERGYKQAELAELKKLLELVPNDNTVKARIKVLQKTINLETYYAQGEQAYLEKRWEEAIEAFKKVLVIEPIYRRGKYSAADLKADAERKLKQEKVGTRKRLFQRNVQQLRSRLARNSIAGLQRVWRLITDNVTLTIIGILVAALAIPGVLQLFETPTVDRVKIFADDIQLAESSIDNKPINLTQLPPLTGGEPVRIKVVVIDTDKMKTYSNYDIKCRWIVTPIDNEIEDIKTEACESLYTPSQSRSKQKVIVEVEGTEQQFKPVPRISMEFEITNN